jgi:DNA-binding transcriptional ArsR family regulator
VDLDGLFRALADPTRRAILDGLAERNGQTLFEICVRLTTRHDADMSRQAVTKHLDVLEETGLIRTTREGRSKFHYLDERPVVSAYDDWLRPHVTRGRRQR